MHEVANDLRSEEEASELRTTRLELDVGECMVEFRTLSLFRLATAAEDVRQHARQDRPGWSTSCGSSGNVGRYPQGLLDAKLRQLQLQMTELKTAVGCSRSAGCLEDHTQATSLDARAEAQLHQLTEAVATCRSP
jgi:hypothetical protein